MAVQLPSWAKYWLVIGGLLVTWDISFVLNRPASLKNGSLHYLFTPYDQYIKYDPIYGDTTDAFGIAQSYINIVEVVLQLSGLLLSYTNRSSAVGPMMVFIASVATLFKTGLYLLYGVCEVHPTSKYHVLRPNTWDTGYVTIFAIPTSFWFICPLALVINLASQFVNVGGTAPPVTENKKKH